MAGDWIKWCKGLAGRREVAVIASRLKRDRHEIAARLMTLWEWCDDNFSENDVDSDSEDVSLFVGDNPVQFVDEIVGLPGVAEALSSPEVCWLSVRSGGRITFPHLARHNGKSAKERALDQKKKKRQRSKTSPKCPDANGTLSGPETEREIEEKESPKGDSKTPLPPSEAERLYQAYPRHEGKGAAIKAIQAALRKAPFDELMQAVTEFAKSPKGKAGSFCPQPATWFNQERWTDDRREWQRSSDDGRRPGPAEPGSGQSFVPGTEARGGLMPDF